MSVEENKELVLRHIEEVYNKEDLSSVDEIMSPDVVFRISKGGYKGSETFKQTHLYTRKAFPDMHVTVNGVVAEGEWVVVRWTLTGTHKGEYYGAPPTNKQIDVEWASFYYFEGDKVVEVSHFVDTLTMFSQLGITPPTPPTEEIKK